MKERIREFLKGKNLTQKDFAEGIGISQGNIGDLLSGRIKSISAEAIAEIARVHKVNPLWLLTGKGDMFLTDADFKGSVVKPFSPEADELMDLFDGLAADKQKQLVEYARFLKGTGKKKA